MNKIFPFLGVIILCILTPIAMMGIHRAQQQVYEQLAPESITDFGDNTTGLTLVELPEPNRASSITKITSTNGPDIPAILAYNPSTKLLTVGGLETDQTRTLEITYFIEAEFMTSLPFIGSVFTVIMYLIPIGLLALIISVVISAFKH